MLTPKQLKSFKFQSVGRNAYKATDVDDFMNQISDSYEQLFNENKELNEKISLLADKLSEFKNDENNIRNALLTAERMKEKIVSEAKDNAEKFLTKIKDEETQKLETIQNHSDEIIGNAEHKAEEILQKANDEYNEKLGSIENDIKKESERLNILKNQNNEIKNVLSKLYERQLELLKQMPDFDNEEEHAEEETVTKEPEVATEETVAFETSIETETLPEEEKTEETEETDEPEKVEETEEAEKAEETEETGEAEKPAEPAEPERHTAQKLNAPLTEYGPFDFEKEDDNIAVDDDDEDEDFSELSIDINELYKNKQDDGKNDDNEFTLKDFM